MPNPYDEMYRADAFGSPRPDWRTQQMDMMGDIYKRERSPKADALMPPRPDWRTQQMDMMGDIYKRERSPNRDSQRVLRGLLDSYENMGQPSPKPKMQGYFDPNDPMFRGGMP